MEAGPEETKLRIESGPFSAIDANLTIIPHVDINISSLELEPCIDFLVLVHYASYFDRGEFSRLNHQQKKVILASLKKFLKEEKLTSLKEELSHRSVDRMDLIRINASDFCKKFELIRTDRVFKIIGSHAKKILINNFKRNNHINQTFSASNYINTTEVYRRIFVHYFRREPVNDEHIEFFASIGYLTRSWFKDATMATRGTLP